MYIPSPRLCSGSTTHSQQLLPQPDERTILSGASSGGSSTLLVEATSQFHQHQKSNTSNSVNEQQHLRKFTSAVGKPGKARETREAISKVLSCANPSRSVPISEPLDYEHFVGEHSAQLEHDKDRDLLLFLRDDISGVEIWPRERTAVPSVRQCDIEEANWLLAMDALRHYSAPYTVINFNYSRFCGQFTKFDSPQGLNFLRFESDLIADEEKLMLSGQSAPFATQSDILKEGNLVVVPGDGIVDTFRSEKKRFCVLRKPVEDSRVYIEVYKQALAQQQHHQQMPTMEMEVKSVSIKNTKKGKILQLTSSAESDKRTLLLSAENETELQFWLFSIERALAWNNREMMLASEEDNLSLNSSGRENSIPPGPSSLNDSESLASEDSGSSRDFSSAFWRSRNAAAKALQPPIVERRNIFSLYWEMEPLPEPEGEKSTLGEQLSETEQCNAERTSPIPSSSATSVNPMLRPNLCSKRTTVYQASSSLDEETNGTPTIRKVTNHFLEPSTSEFAGEKPAILFTAQLKKLDVRIRLAGKEQAEQIEPFFARLFLFDNGLGVRVSEEFHVDFPLHQCDMSQRNGHSAFKLANSSPLSSFSLDDVLTSGKVNGISCEMIRNANKLICSIHNPRPDLFLVVLVERILSDVSADIYLKTNHITDNKYLSKIQKALSASIPRLGHLRTLFAWTARPVFPSLCLGGAFASQQMTINSSSNDAFTPSDGNGTKKGSLAMCSLYKCDSGRLTDGDLQKLLTEMQKADKLAKLVALPSAALVLETDVTSVLCEFPMRISSSFLPLRPWRSPSYSPEKPSVLPSFELQSFLHQSLSSEPNRGRVNLLYVYPISLNYSTQKTFSRARNISCTVRYVPSSVVRKAQFVGGRVPSRAHIFHRTHPNGPFVDSFVCGVQYHEQSPQFNTEVKMDLPTSLAEDDHILFTFHHISISSAVTNKNKTSAEHNIEMPVGYAWLPLVRKDARGLPHLVMSDNCQEFELPVAANWSSKYFEFKHLSSSGIREVPSNYDVKFVENGRPLFRVRLRLVSSVFTTDERLQSFFQMCQRLYPNISQVDNISLMQSSNLSSCDYNIKQSPSLRLYANNTSKNDFSIERNLVESIEKLSSIDLDQLIPFLEIVLDRLFSLLTLSKAEDVMLSSLGAIICLADQLFMHRKSKRDLLRNYIRLSFKCQSPPSKCDADGDESTHGAICKCIPLMIHRAQTSKEGLISITKLLRQLWFLLDCAAKSMAHWLIIHNLLKMPRRNRFPTDLYFCLEEMFHTITERIIFMQTECPRESRMANSALGNFLKHCLSLMDRHQIMKELYTAIKKMDTIESRSFRVYKFELLQLLVGHEHWVPLCLPLLTDKFGIIMRGDNFRIEGSSNQTQQQSTKHNGGTSLLAKLFSQIFSPFHGIISESNEVEKFSSYSEHFFLSKTYCSLHFPIGLVFQELLASLRDSRDHRHKVIRLLRNLLAKHSRDERYGDTSARSRIAMLTMPLLRIAIENIKEIEATAVSTNTFTDTQNNSTIMPDNCQNRLLLLTATTHELGRRGEMESNGTVSINGTINSNDNNGKNNNKTNGPNGATVVVVLAEKLDKSEVCDLMLCVLYTLSGLPKKMLSAFWNTQEAIQPLKTPSNCSDLTTELSKHPQQQQHQQSQQNVLVDFARLLELSLLLFRYRGRTHHLMLQAKRNKATNSNKTYDFLKSDGSNSYRISSKFSTLNEMTLGESFDSRGMTDEEGKGGEATSFLMDCNLAQEVALIVLETIQTIANQLAAKTRYASTGTSDAVFLRLLHLQIELIRECWPETVRLHTLSALAVFINLFSTRFFNSGPLDCLSTLIKALLLQLNSRIVRIQTATAALLHLILRSGYDVALNTSVFPQAKFPSDFSSVSAADGSKNSFLTERLGRPGAQIAPVLARLLSEKAVLLNNFRFERGLSALESLVGGGPSTKGGGAGGSTASSSALVLTSLFDKAVLELVKQLRGVLEATQAISDTINDPVHLADLHIQLANSFRGSAALRAEFFDALAAQHLSGAWYSEAAVCQAHSLVIIGKELQGRGLIRPDWTLLDVLSERIAATEGVNESSLMGSTQQGGFTVEEFTRKVEELVRVLLLSERYEAVGPICRLAIPIFEQNNDFKALVGIYAEIQQACSRAAEIKVSGKRHLGTYFKVTFYGNSHFGTEHLTEWIFREPKLTTLAEACDRMVQLVRNAIGHDQVKVISGRSEANDPAIAFIKVAHVEPCRRPTELNNNNIMSTKSGREKGRVVLMTNGGRESEQPKSEGKEDDDPLGYNLHTNISTFIQEERLVDQEVPENAPELARTALRRLTLTVENSFPDSRRRQRIIKTEEAVLNPLELACECLFFKAAQIRHILSAADIPRGCHHYLGTTFDKNALKRLDLKKLQLFLQGSVSPSVNAGLLAYAETFTASAQRHRYGKDGIYRLAAALKTLITELNEALAVNEAAMGSERTEYQQMLRRSFDGMLERLPTFFDGEKFLPDTGGQDGRSAIGVANSQLMNGVLDRLSQIGGTAAEMHIFDSISGLNG